MIGLSQLHTAVWLDCPVVIDSNSDSMFVVYTIERDTF